MHGTLSRRTRNSPGQQTHSVSLSLTAMQSQSPARTLQEAHQLRLQQLLESGRFTPAPSPPPTEEAAAKSASVDPASKGKGQGRGKGKKRGLASTLAAVAESAPQHLPDSIDFIVAVSTRTNDVSLENDHNLHCLCAFPTHQSAYDYIVSHRLSLARHYMRDPRLSQAELDAATASAGMDELYLGEHTSMEVLAVPHFRSTAAAPPPLEGGALFADHFASSRAGDEDEHEAEILSEKQQMEQAQGDNKEENKEGEAADETAAAAPTSGGKKGAKATAVSTKSNKRRKQ